MESVTFVLQGKNASGWRGGYERKKAYRPPRPNVILVGLPNVDCQVVFAFSFRLRKRYPLFAASVKFEECIQHLRVGS